MILESSWVFTPRDQSYSSEEWQKYANFHLKASQFLLIAAALVSSLQRKNWSASLSNEAKPRPKSEFWKIRRDLDFGGGGGNDVGGAVAANARSVAGVFLTLGYWEGNEFKT